MDYSSYSKFKLGTLILAMVAVSACSSSKVEDGQGTPPEMVSDLQGAPPAEASTDAVPAPDAKPADVAAAGGQPAPDALDASALDAPQDSTPSAAPGAVVDAPPAVADAPTAGAADSDPLAANAAPVPSDIPAAPVTEAPVADAPVSEPMVVADAASEPVATVAPTHGHKGKGKKHRHSSVAAAVAPSGDGVHYQVKQGDTLMKIAFENYGDLYRWKEVYEANRANIPDPSHVAPGTQLTLNGAGLVTIERNGDRYMIKHGDTLGTISHDVYGNAHQWKKLWENNRQLIKDPNKIYAGFYLYYQPEGRLSHDQKQEVVPSASTTTPGVAPGVVAAMKNNTPTTQNVAQNTVQPAAVTPATAATANTAPANTGARAPASVK